MEYFENENYQGRKLISGSQLFVNGSCEVIDFVSENFWTFGEQKTNLNHIKMIEAAPTETNKK